MSYHGRMQIEVPEAAVSVAERLVRQGVYDSISDAVAGALDAVDLEQRKLAALRSDIAAGLAQLDAGEGRPLDIQKIKEMARASLQSTEAST